MKVNQRVVTVLVGTALFAAAGTAQQAQAPQQPAGQSVWAAPAQPGVQSTTPSACGNQPMCYDSQDFAVAVVDFRMSLTNGFKMMDATLRFVNKTNQPLILGYVDASAVALDDQGNRYNPYGNRNLAGIGIVNGNSGDPKFTLPAGGAGDARWELLWRPGPQDPVGSTFDLSMTVREMNTLVGGAHTLGAEVPLRFQGLANGMTGAGVSAGYAAAPGVAGASPLVATGTTTGLPPCGTGATLTNVAGAVNSVGGQQTAAATTTASNTATGAAAALSNLKSVFGRKNAATAPAANVAGAAPCVPAATSAAMPVAAGTSTAPATAGQAATAATASATAATAAKAAPSAATTPQAVAPNAANLNAARTPAAASAGKAAVVTTAAPNAKPAVQPATAAVKKPAPAAAAKPAAKPAPTPTNQTPPAKTPTNQ